jgi:hypothetical protein
MTIILNASKKRLISDLIWTNKCFPDMSEVISVIRRPLKYDAQLEFKPMTVMELMGKAYKETKKEAARAKKAKECSWAIQKYFGIIQGFSSEDVILLDSEGDYLCSVTSGTIVSNVGNPIESFELDKGKSIKETIRMLYKTKREKIKYISIEKTKMKSYQTEDLKVVQSYKKIEILEVNNSLLNIILL